MLMLIAILVRQIGKLVLNLKQDQILSRMNLKANRINVSLPRNYTVTRQVPT